MPFSFPEIQRPGRELQPVVQKHLDSLTKPPGSLGRLEELARSFCVMRGSAEPVLNKRAVFTFAADHGVSQSGVSAYPREVTAQMVLNFIRGGAAINVLCRHYGIENVVVDAGVDYDFGGLEGLINRKIACGTQNFLERPAMTEDQAFRAIQIGIDLAKDYDLIGTGDMGIGNTTSSAAILSVLTGMRAEDVVGRGTGVDEDQMKHKANVIRDALERHKPDPARPLDVLAKVGGFEIGAIAGIIIGAASRRIPVVVDGFISGAGAMIAVSLNPACRDYLFFSHLSRERGHKRMLEFLDARPILDLDMCLGEGTGAAVAIDIITAATRIYNEMATFESAAVSRK
ncbi:MAG TPA: nicotinate-nucleotide--dimethylbenzimidazole phosphoribosyltransferase [Terriglobia bacterium]|jgi:nicotinate-nucleotide--dimethylbenzimidazole phosphoribosyltransferase